MVNNNMDLMDWLRKQVEEADADFLREAVSFMVASLMDAEVSAICGADLKRQTGGIGRDFSKSNVYLTVLPLPPMTAELQVPVPRSALTDIFTLTVVSNRMTKTRANRNTCRNACYEPDNSAYRALLVCHALLALQSLLQ